jgi:hypothetical protein
VGVQNPPDSRGVSSEAPLLVPVLKGKRWESVMATWHAMMETAEVDPDPFNESPNHRGGDHSMVWSGHISKLVGELGYHASTGTQIIKDLERIASIEVLEEGKRGKLTRIKLIAPPDQERFLDYKDGLYDQVFGRDAEVLKKEELDASLLARISELEKVQQVLIDEFQKFFEAHKHLEISLEDHFHSEDYE